MALVQVARYADLREAQIAAGMLRAAGGARDVGPGHRRGRPGVHGTAASVTAADLLVLFFVPALQGRRKLGAADAHIDRG
jgi:hypothetical protein